MAALAAALALGVGVGSPWTAASLDPSFRTRSDFQILWAAGQGLAEGQDSYDPAVLDTFGARAGRSGPTPFCAAPPLVVRAFGELDGGDFQRAYKTWLIAGWVALGLGFALLVSAGRALGRPVAVALAAALAALGLGEGTWMSLAMNSTNLLALVALLGALLASQKGREGLEGVLLAVAVVAKTSPALMLLVVLVAGRRRALLAAGATLALALVVSLAWVGWAPHASWAGRTLPALGYAPELDAGRFDNSLHAWNLAPNGILSRELVRGELPPNLARLGAWLVTAIVLVQLVVSLRSTAGDDSPGERWRQYALGITSSFLVSSVTWPHHLVLAAVPAAWLLGDRLRGRLPEASSVVGLAACVLLFLPLGTLSPVADGEQRIDVGAKALGCVVLWAVCARAGPAPGGTPEASRA